MRRIRPQFTVLIIFRVSCFRFTGAPDTPHDALGSAHPGRSRQSAVFGPTERGRCGAESAAFSPVPPSFGGCHSATRTVFFG